MGFYDSPSSSEGEEMPVLPKRKVEPLARTRVIDADTFLRDEAKAGQGKKIDLAARLLAEKARRPSYRHLEKIKKEKEDKIRAEREASRERAQCELLAEKREKRHVLTSSDNSDEDRRSKKKRKKATIAQEAGDDASSLQGLRKEKKKAHRNRKVVPYDEEEDSNQAEEDRQVKRIEMKEVVFSRASATVKSDHDDDSDMNDDYIPGQDVSPVSKRNVGHSSEPRNRQDKTKHDMLQFKEEEEEEENTSSGEDEQYPSFMNAEYQGKNEPLVLKLADKEDQDQFPHAPELSVPASISRYLGEHQKDGIAFLYRLWATHRGGILAHDMGLGKTLQTVAFAAALLGLTGTKRKDRARMKRRKALYFQAVQQYQSQNLEEKKDASLCGDNNCILILVPKPTVGQWMTEFNKWTRCFVEKIDADTEMADRVRLLERARHGGIDILICSRALALANLDWNLGPKSYLLVVFDEIHELKNPKSIGYNAALEKIKPRTATIIGLTGTPLQNDTGEAHALLTLCTTTDFGERKEFAKQFEKPISRGRAIWAPRETRALAMERQLEFKEILAEFVQKKSKEGTLKEKLVGKEELIIKCPLTDFQKEVYQRVTQLPDVQMIRDLNKVCTCARGKQARIKRRDCCYRPTDILGPLPNMQRYFFASTVHGDRGLCEHCPKCYYLKIQDTLLKIADHPTLLQVDRTRKEQVERRKSMAALARLAFGDEEFRKRGSDRSDRLDDLSRVEDSGKLKFLHKLLISLYRGTDQETGEPNKVLIFTQRTQILDILEALLKRLGYDYVRFDGSMSTRARNGVIKKFSDPKEHIFAAIISSGAGGTGLNLQAANIVVQYDINWNPAKDQQSQDRSFRIGQSRFVKIFRLLSIGTIEELKWMRQIYKRAQTASGFQTTDEFDQTGFRFKGVKNEKKGELFGMENMIKFSETSILDELQKKRQKKKAPNQTSTTSESDRIVPLSKLEGLIQEADENDLEEIGLAARADDFITKPVAENENYIPDDDSDKDDNEEFLQQAPPPQQAHPPLRTVQQVSRPSPLVPPTERKPVPPPQQHQTSKMMNPKDNFDSEDDDDDDGW